MTVSEQREPHVANAVYLDSGQLTELGRFHFLCVESAKMGFGPALPANEAKPSKGEREQLDLHTAAAICYGRDHYAETLARQNTLMSSVDRSLDGKA
jgi:hypothetical protein